MAVRELARTSSDNPGGVLVAALVFAAVFLGVFFLVRRLRRR